MVENNTSNKLKSRMARACSENEAGGGSPSPLISSVGIIYFRYRALSESFSMVGRDFQLV